GCPWDRKQTLSTIKPYTLEETYELLEAIDSDDNAAIQEELGDVLLQVILDSQIAADEQRFDLTNVVRQIADKMVRRHPHVFGSETASTTDDVKQHWHAAKSNEKPDRQSQLDGIPKGLPQLARAARLSARAAAVGYDFPDRRMLFAKLREEIAELAAELFDGGDVQEVAPAVDVPPVPDVHVTDSAERVRIEGELGDVLFVVANIARRWGISPEEALRKSNAKFARRFRAIEAAMKEQNKSLTEAGLPEMEAAYQAAKARESRHQIPQDGHRPSIACNHTPPPGPKR
ncbi:MAG: nucleoside triphosphate pyrophosphohydrolase, partial [Planctomycetaceae bacterium]|nr:nucleoside triphosphate pyrophosphohydrolase [Planctomycetaceae bacterium]